MVGTLRENDDLSDFQKQLWLASFGNRKLPTAAPWFAAPKAPKQAQAEVANWLLNGGRVPDQSRDLFGLMHFCAGAHPDVLNVPTRLKLLQPKFESIRAESLQSYYQYLVRRLLAGLKARDPLRRAMQCFAGCEVMELAEELASASVAALSRIVEDLDEAVRLMMVFLEADAAAARKQRKPRRPEPGDTENREKSSYFYREWVIRKFLSEIMERKGTDTYDLLAAHNWFNPDWQAPTVFYMRKYFNLELGRWYRSRLRRNEWLAEHAAASYVGLVRRLVETGSHRMRHIAHYLIRHSEVSEWRESFPVDEVFHPCLRAIYSDPLVDVPDGLYRANLDDFEEIRDARLRKARQLGIELGRQRSQIRSGAQRPGAGPPGKQQ
jgi:hypothetical protein